MRGGSAQLAGAGAEQSETGRGDRADPIHELDPGPTGPARGRGALALV